MKGVPEEPRCGFSNAVVQILRMHGVTYDAHDVLKDEGLRQGKLLRLFIIVSSIYIELSQYFKYFKRRMYTIFYYYIKNV